MALKFKKHTWFWLYEIDACGTCGQELRWIVGRKNWWKVRTWRYSSQQAPPFQPEPTTQQPYQVRNKKQEVNESSQWFGRVRGYSLLKWFLVNNCGWTKQLSLGQKGGTKMKYYPGFIVYPVIHCQLSDGATRQKKASPWALSFWINLAAVKLQMFFCYKMGCTTPPGQFEVFFLTFSVSTWTIYSYSSKKKATLEATLPKQRGDFRTAQGGVGLWCSAKKIGHKKTRDAKQETEIPLFKTSHTKSNIATNMYMMFQMSMTFLQFSIILVILVKFH